MSAPTTQSVATLGNTPLGTGFMGPQREPRYNLEIQTATGDRVVVEEPHKLDVTLRHTQLSDWSAEISMQPELGGRILSSVALRFGGNYLFEGRLDGLSHKGRSPKVSISGDGIGVGLTRGKLSFSFRGVTFLEALRRAFGMTDYSVNVIPPESDGHPAYRRIGIDTGDEDDTDVGDYNGTPMSVVKDLCKKCGMRFSVLHARPGRHIEVYAAGSRRRNREFDVLDDPERDMGAKGYANRVIVTGALKGDGSGERIEAVAQDDAEIAEMRKRGVGNDGVVEFPIRSDEYKTHDEAMAEAESTLADLVDKDTVGGSFEITPMSLVPGYNYWLPGSFGSGRAYGEGYYGEGFYGSPGGRYVTLNSVSYSISRGDSSCSVDFSQQDGFADELKNTIGGRT